MAKGQKKSNKEVRKPKAGAASKPQPAASLFANGSLTPPPSIRQKNPQS